MHPQRSAVFQHALQNIVTVKTPLYDCQCFSFSTPALYLTSHSELHSSSLHSISNWADVVRLFHSLDVPSVPRPFVKRQQPFMRPFRYRYIKDYKAEQFWYSVTTSRNELRPVGRRPWMYRTGYQLVDSNSSSILITRNVTGPSN
ncbi:hypothetical protein EIP91_010679, partial [Steccherinum ochraceum]